MKAMFGPGGNSASFAKQGFRSAIQAPEWVRDFGLDMYEYEAGNGIAASDETLAAIGIRAAKAGILLSFHTPYFISLSSVNEETRIKSIDYIKKSLDAARLMSAYIIVIHTGSAGKIPRSEALRLAADTIAKTLEEIGDGYDGIRIGLETMGKINQLGTLDEVTELCSMDRRLYPVVDFGHLNARNLGGLYNSGDDYLRVFDKISSKLGNEKAETLHCHFSKIEYTSGGEKKHLTFEDTEYGPDFEPLCRVIADNGLAPRIICESAGTQAEDALTMKKCYEAG